MRSGRTRPDAGSLHTAANWLSFSRILEGISFTSSFASVTISSVMWNDPYLLHRYHRVVALPGFRDLTVGDAAYIYPRLRHSVAGGSDAHEIPIVGTCARPARRDKVPLGDL